MKNKGKNDYLIHRILDKIEGSSVDWRKETSGNRSLKTNRRILTGRASQSFWKRPGCWNSAGLIQIKWLEYGNDIEKITYRLEQAGQFYELLGLTFEMGAA